jgi:hypothetical protein
LFEFFIYHAYCMPCQSHPPWFDHHNKFWRIPSLCNFLEPPVTSSILSPNILFSLLFLHESVFSLHVTHKFHTRTEQQVKIKFCVF